ncbi:MAG: mechanosensitive ion channel family protein [Bacteroidetes bacterium]|nr:MAG: mechanosensitive ion channel family protein [Bacteroidota bacterium]
MDQNILDQQYFGLIGSDWAIMIGVWLLSSLILMAVKRVLISRLAAKAAKTENKIDDIGAEVLGATRTFFILIMSAYAAVEIVSGGSPAFDTIRRLAFIGLLLQVGFWVNALIDSLAKWYTTRGQDEGASTQKTAVKAFGMVGRLVAWSILVLLLLENFGVDVTALIAGLGIGGLAVALAIRPILEDIFAYFSIIVDKPFENGDYVVAGSFSGTVQHVGIKTTRFTSGSGEEIIFPNSDLLSSRLRNYKKMKERRADYSVGVTYDTPQEKLEKLAGQIREIIEAEEDVRFDRGHLTDFGDSAIIFQFVYYMQNPAFAFYRDTQERINLKTMGLFQREGIEFAFPTQTLHIESIPASLSGSNSEGRAE